jgi:hypothetical protein
MNSPSIDGLLASPRSTSAVAGRYEVSDPFRAAHGTVSTGDHRSPNRPEEEHGGDTSSCVCRRVHTIEATLPKAVIKLVACNRNRNESYTAAETPPIDRMRKGSRSQPPLRDSPKDICASVECGAPTRELSGTAGIDSCFRKSRRKRKGRTGLSRKTTITWIL